MKIEHCDASRVLAYRMAQDAVLKMGHYTFAYTLVPKRGAHKIGIYMQYMSL